MPIVQVFWNSAAATPPQRAQFAGALRQGMAEAIDYDPAFIGVSFVDAETPTRDIQGPTLVVYWTQGHTAPQKERVCALAQRALTEATGCAAMKAAVIFMDMPRGDIGAGGVIINYGGGAGERK